MRLIALFLGKGNELLTVAGIVDMNLHLFNSPKELVLFPRCRSYGNSPQLGKRRVILDTEPFRYRTFLHTEGSRSGQTAPSGIGWPLRFHRKG